MSNLRLSDVRLILTGLPVLCSRYDDVPGVYIKLTGAAPEDPSKRDEVIERARTRCDEVGICMLCFHTDPDKTTPEARVWLDPHRNHGALTILRRYNALREFLKAGGWSDAAIDEIEARRSED